MWRAVALMIVACLAAPAASACEASVAEKAELATTSFDFAISVRKVEPLRAVSFLPERIVEEGAAEAGTSPEEYRRLLTRVLRSDLLEQGFTEYRLHHRDAVCGATAEGLRYWLIPSTGRIARVGGEDLPDRNLYLAFPEGTRMAVIPIGSAYWRTELFRFYPAFARDPGVAAALEGRG